MIAGIFLEMQRLTYTIQQIKENGSNRAGLDPAFMEACLMLLTAYRELHHLREDQRPETAEGYLALTSIAPLLEGPEFDAVAFRTIWDGKLN